MYKILGINTTPTQKEMLESMLESIADLDIRFLPNSAPLPNDIDIQDTDVLILGTQDNPVHALEEFRKAHHSNKTPVALYTGNGKETDDGLETILTQIDYIIPSKCSSVYLEKTIQLLAELRHARLKDNEARLLESQARLLAAQQIAGMGDFLWEVDTGIVTWSDTLYEMLGYEKGSAINLDEVNRNIHHPEDLEKVMYWLNTAIGSGDKKLSPLEYRLLKKDGSVMHVRTKGIIYRGQRSGPRILGVIKDLTEERAGYAALWAGEEKYREIFNSTSEAIFVDDVVNRKVIDCNERAIELYGYDSKEELLSTQIGDISAGTPEYNEDKAQEKIEKTINEGPQTFEWLAKKKDGTVFWVEVSLRKSRIGGQGRVLAVIRDISQRKAAEEALRSSNERYRAVVEHSQESLVIVDEEYRFTYCNPAACLLLGRDKQELTGMDFREILDGQSLDMVTDFYHRRQKGEKVPSHYTFNVVRKNGEVRMVEISSTIWRTNDRQIRTIAQLLDVTERSQAESAVKQEEEKFRSLVTQMEQGLAVHEAIIDKNGKMVDYRFIDVNPGFERMTGLKREDLIGKTVLEVLPETENHWLEEYEKVVKTGKPVHLVDYSSELGKHYEVLAYRNRANQFAVITIDITDRKVAEIALRESEERFRAVVESSPVSILLVQQRKILFGNRQAAIMLGYNSPEKLTGKNALDIIPETHQELVEERLANVQEGKNNEPIEIPLVKLDGTLRWTISTSVSIQMDGKKTAIIVSQDIDEHRQTKEELKRASENWNKTFDSIKDGIALLDADQHIQMTNRAFKKFILRPGEKELKGHKCFMLVHGTDHPHEDCPFQRMTRSKKRESMEMRVNGNTVEVTVDPILGNKGEIQGAVHIISDITQRKREEKIRKVQYNVAHSFSTTESLKELLEVVREELGQLMDTSNFFVAFYDAQEEVLRSSLWADEKDNYQEWPARGTFSGFVIKSKRSLLLKKGDIKEMAAREGLDLKGSLPECWLGVPLLIRNEIAGVIVIQHYSNPDAYSPLSKEILEIIANQLGVYIDKKQHELDLIEAKDKAEESDRLKTAFLTNMSHEIRTPMNGIVGFIDLLQNPGLSLKQQDVYFNVVRKSSKRLLETINDIIEISKIESGQLSVNPEPIDLKQLTAYLYNFFKPEAEEKGLELRVSDAEQLPEMQVLTDRIKLESILTNFLKNAIKFTPEGSVELSYELENGNLVLQVRDTGIGIPPAKQKEIFERFIQADMRTSRAYEGSGLGLSIANAYAEMLDGEIRVESEPGEGSIFSVVIPYNAVASPERTPATITGKEETASEETAVILVAEDDDTSYYFLEVILREEGYLPIRTRDGSETIEKLEANPSTLLILMDLKMPGMDGYEATRRIREFDKDIPIIAQTAYAFSGDREKAVVAGCNDYIAKPIDKNELLTKIKEHVKGT